MSEQLATRCRKHDPVRAHHLNVCRACGKVQVASGTKFGRPAFWHTPRGDQQRLAAESVCSQSPLSGPGSR